MIGTQIDLFCKLSVMVLSSAGTASNSGYDFGVYDMRQDKERSIREQADLWKGYWCILACILLVGRVSYLTFFQNHIVSVYAAAQTEQKEDSSVQILQENLMEEIQIDDVQKIVG